MERSEEEMGALQKYGFGNQRSGVFSRLQVGSVGMATLYNRPTVGLNKNIHRVPLNPLKEELGDVIDLKNPEGTSASERRRARLEAEASAFSSDHYL